MNIYWLQFRTENFHECYFKAGFPVQFYLRASLWKTTILKLVNEHSLNLRVYLPNLNEHIDLFKPLWFYICPVKTTYLPHLPSWNISISTCLFANFPSTHRWLSRSTNFTFHLGRARCDRTDNYSPVSNSSEAPQQKLVNEKGREERGIVLEMRSLVG